MMPQMPGMPEIKNNDESGKLDSSFASPEIEEKSPEADVFKKPELNIADFNNKTKVDVLPSKKGIEVVALRKGFYNQNRYNEGSKFSIKSENDFGEWFYCVDKYFENKRQEFLKAKKANK
jgi:hypothetical protein